MTAIIAAAWHHRYFVVALLVGGAGITAFVAGRFIEGLLWLLLAAYQVVVWSYDRRLTEQRERITALENESPMIQYVFITSQEATK